MIERRVETRVVAGQPYGNLSQQSAECYDKACRARVESATTAKCEHQRGR